MPTILMILGWRLLFYANERKEPAHIHCRKGNCECKYGLDSENYELREAYNYNLSQRDRREVKKIIYQHFDYILSEWDKFQEGRNE
jgi:meiotically up-regulated gene 157 (Mug157) protein